MSKYHHRASNYYVARKRRYLRRVVASFTALLVIVGIVVAVDVYISSRSSTSVVSSETNSVVLPRSTNILRSQFFQFQASDQWRAVAGTALSANQFVYRALNGQLTEQELVISVSNTPKEVLANTQISRVYPVKPTPDGRLESDGGISAHCKTLLPAGSSRVPLNLTYKQVLFPCNPDAGGYIVVVGAVGGGIEMSLPRPNSLKTSYTIMYKNLKANPNSNDIDDIIKTFQTL